jgi:hypothetical protein
MSKNTCKAQAQQQAHYKIKYHKMEERIREILFLNASLESEINETRLQVKRARSDRQILLHKLLGYEATEDKTTENKTLNTMLPKKTSKNDKPLVSPRSTTTNSKKKKTNGETMETS